MKRREFLKVLGATSLFPYASSAFAVPSYANSGNILVLIELSGGNDGLNTVVPYADSEYYRLRPSIAIPRDQVLQLNAATGLHPYMTALMPIWQANELAIVQGVSYPSPNLSHFRSIEIMETGSGSAEYLIDGWLTRLYREQPLPINSVADGVVIGKFGMGPFVGSRRALALGSVKEFLDHAGTVDLTTRTSTNTSLQFIFDVEAEIRRTANTLNANVQLNTAFPATALGNAMKAASQVIAGTGNIPVIKIRHAGFDTHINQLPTHARLLKELAEAMAAFKSAMKELSRWDSTIVMTYAEFGRRPKENAGKGTDHGTANAHFLMGGKVKGGLYGQAPQLSSLNGGSGNLPPSVDYRALYATVIQNFWGLRSDMALRGRFAPLDILEG